MLLEIFPVTFLFFNKLKMLTLSYKVIKRIRQLDSLFM